MAETDDYPVPDFPGLLRLDGKGYLVAGGGLGMGRQTAHALASCGAKVAVADVDPERAEAVAAQIGGIAVSGDLRDRAEVERVVDEAETGLGRLDGLVDIIGLAEWSSALDMPDDMWDRQFAMCLRHGVLLGQTVGRRLVESGNGGTMVFVASVSGLDSAPNHAAYGAAKAGLMSWVRTLAVELGPHGVRANAIAPGAIHTPRLYGMDRNGADSQAPPDTSRAPLGRSGETYEIAGPALFLSSDLSSYVTGRVLVVDGGVDVLFMGIAADQMPGT